MPVRKIPKSASSITGRAYSVCSGRSLGHESGLERDLYLSSAFLPGLQSIEEQPARIESSTNSYHPDTSIRLVIEGPWNTSTKALLIEVKYLADLIKQWEELRPRLQLGLDYARGLGMTFKVITDQEIRGPDFACVRMLRRFLGHPVTEAFRTWVLEQLTMAPASMLLLLSRAVKFYGCTPEKVTPSIWALVARQEIHISPKPCLSLHTQLHAPGTLGTTRWLPCSVLIDSLLADWEVRP